MLKKTHFTCLAAVVKSVINVKLKKKKSITCHIFLPKVACFFKNFHNLPLSEIKLVLASNVELQVKYKHDFKTPSRRVQRQVGHGGASGREESSTKHGLLKAVK
jgi:hypothetical protein